jgi:hypothetical protein
MKGTRFARKGATGVGNSTYGIIIPTEAGNQLGLEKTKHYIFEVRFREVETLEELEEWQKKKFEIIEEPKEKKSKNVGSSISTRYVQFMGLPIVRL